ncbi:DUF4825 domain-containing protein [Ruminiclostridium cellulolyticum]|uniref:DUF4825 domain-containing protein n=1 Tax=Ruminiclostridium cellulolyticum (strain ATCC 35319 / DSM 5812 / JCM 6584 / H10) TaxID=394503 RepID=B8I5Z9_RUMCH|nr:DUF4825 domain-containing protein [Ruminiclostridium cellulolyticum]ACL74816.1 hypothetical protein Ccel_0433 [Ruminiclostridium cellulolyticum H10]
MKNSAKKVLTVLVFITCVVALVIILVFASKGNTPGIIDSNNSTKINASGQVYNADYLFENKTPYVGNNSKVLHIIDNLQFGNYRGEVSLQTEKIPYGVTVNYDFQNLVKEDYQKAKIENEERLKLAFKRNAAMMFCLIENLDKITFVCRTVKGTAEYGFTREEIQKDYNEDLKEYSKDKNKFGRFAITLNNDNLIIHSMKKYSPTMSSVVGLKIMSTYEGKADNIRYTATDGKLILFDGNSAGKQGNTLTVEKNTPIFWSPLSGDDTSFKADKIVVKVEVLNQGIKIAEQNLNIKKEGITYIIEENINVIADI